MTTKTGESVKQLYKVFKRYRFTDMEGDPAFPGLCDPAPLLAEPLAVLPREAFDMFAWKAVTTWGTADDLRHFLPRMLELLADGGEAYPLEAWSLFGKIAYAQWRKWPGVEQEAIQDYIDARWFDLLHQEVRLADTKNHLDKTQAQSINELAHAIQFLEPSLYDGLLGQWSACIDERVTDTPVLLLAETYLELFGGWMVYEPKDRFRHWLLEPKRIEQLSAEWEMQQNEAVKSQYFSDVHVAAENWIANH
ncbi:MAG: hypothetical protein AAF711_19430 [Planctomycetota bacterium]